MSTHNLAQSLCKNAPKGVAFLQSHMDAHPSLPPEAILKQDLLRRGLRFSPEAFKCAGIYKPKDYFIFSFDHVRLSEMDEITAKGAPEEIRFSGGPWLLKPTVVSVRVSPQSPYVVKAGEHGPVLELEGEILSEVEFHHLPAFYGCELKSGKKISELVPVLEWGYLLYITAFRLCQYWGKKEECAFCDINENYRQQRGAGRPYTGVKEPEHILEALEIVNEKDNTAQAYTLTGGSVTHELAGLKEVDFYLRYIEAIEKRFARRWISKAVVQAFELDDCKRLKNAGLQIYHPNYEVWDAQLFSKLCPGKEAYIGRQRWLDRVVASAQVFGPENVIPNFVGGVELSVPHGFLNLDQALASTAEGLDFFMSHGICPRFTTWCPEPTSSLGHQSPPPLEYFCRLLEIWRDTRVRYNLPPIPGYGPAGAGRAVFSVSAFMDVLE